MKFVLFAIISTCTLLAMDTVTFPSGDGLEITADYYPAKNPNAPMILLCHQARWSRGEYRETAVWLNSLGFQAMAIDQRSGQEVNGVGNETYKRAGEQGLPTNYLDAKRDIEAAIRYARETYKPTKLILMGSSYSAALAIRIAGEKKFPVEGVAAFSPGEYFQDKQFLAKVAGDIDVPTFITSAQNEASYWQPFAEKINGELLTTFLPGIKGEHGSRALWKSNNGHELYRQALVRFLTAL